jgi:hypothetical protein
LIWFEGQAPFAFSRQGEGSENVLSCRQNLFSLKRNTFWEKNGKQNFIEI